MQTVYIVQNSATKINMLTGRPDERVIKSSFELSLLLGLRLAPQELVRHARADLREQ